MIRRRRISPLGARKVANCGERAARQGKKGAPALSDGRPGTGSAQIALAGSSSSLASGSGSGAGVGSSSLPFLLSGGGSRKLTWLATT